MLKNKVFLNLQITSFISMIGDILFYPIMLILAVKTANVIFYTSLTAFSENISKILVIPLIPKIFNIRYKRIYLNIAFFLRFLIYILIGMLILNFNTKIFILIIILNVISDILGLTTTQIEIDYTKKLLKNMIQKHLILLIQKGCNREYNS